MDSEESLEPMMIRGSAKDSTNNLNDYGIRSSFHWWKTQLSDYEFIKALFLFGLVGIFALIIIYYILFPTPLPPTSSPTQLKTVSNVADGLKFSTVENLRQHIHTTSIQAKKSNTLSTIPISTSTNEYNGIEYVYCKPTQLAQPIYNEISTPKSDSYDPLALENIDETLIVHHFADQTASAWQYSIVLNKYNTILDHCLLISNTKQPQEKLLTSEEFVLWFWSIVQINGVGFYNSNKLAGASQAHRHLQLLPLDSLWPLRSPDTTHATALDDLILPKSESKQWNILPYSITNNNQKNKKKMRSFVYQLPEFPFQHAIILLDKTHIDNNNRNEQEEEQFASWWQDFGDYLLAVYEVLLDSMHLDPIILQDCALRRKEPQNNNSSIDCRSYGAYNLIVTTNYMMIIPRKVSPPFDLMNSMVFLGLIMINNDEIQHVVNDGGPLALYKQITLKEL